MSSSNPVSKLLRKFAAYKTAWVQYGLTGRVQPMNVNKGMRVGLGGQQSQPLGNTFTTSSTPAVQNPQQPPPQKPVQTQQQQTPVDPYSLQRQRWQQEQAAQAKGQPYNASNGPPTAEPPAVPAAKETPEQLQDRRYRQEQAAQSRGEAYDASQGPPTAAPEAQPTQARSATQQTAQARQAEPIQAAPAGTATQTPTQQPKAAPRDPWAEKTQRADAMRAVEQFSQAKDQFAQDWMGNTSQPTKDSFRKEQVPMEPVSVDNWETNQGFHNYLQQRGINTTQLPTDPNKFNAAMQTLETQYNSHIKEQSDKQNLQNYARTHTLSTGPGERYTQGLRDQTPQQQAENHVQRLANREAANTAQHQALVSSLVQDEVRAFNDKDDSPTRLVKSLSSAMAMPNNQDRVLYLTNIAQAAGIQMGLRGSYLDGYVRGILNKAQQHRAGIDTSEQAKQQRVNSMVNDSARLSQSAADVPAPLGAAGISARAGVHRPENADVGAERFYNPTVPDESSRTVNPVQRSAPVPAPTGVNAPQENFDTSPMFRGAQPTAANGAGIPGPLGPAVNALSSSMLGAAAFGDRKGLGAAAQGDPRFNALQSAFQSAKTPQERSAAYTAMRDYSHQREEETNAAWADPNNEYNTAGRTLESAQQQREDLSRKTDEILGRTEGLLSPQQRAANFDRKQREQVRSEAQSARDAAYRREIAASSGAIAPVGGTGPQDSWMPTGTGQVMDTSLLRGDPYTGDLLGPKGRHGANTKDLARLLGPDSNFARVTDAQIRARQAMDDTTAARAEAGDWSPGERPWRVPEETWKGIQEERKRMGKKPRGFAPRGTMFRPNPLIGPNSWTGELDEGGGTQ